MHFFSCILSAQISAIFIDSNVHETLKSSAVHIEMGGKLSSPTLWLEKMDLTSIVVSWGLPQTFGTALEGFQLRIDDKNQKEIISSKHRRATIKTEANRFLRNFFWNFAISSKKFQIVPY